MIENVAALYVDPLGPYPELVAHWYDEARDARKYAGPWPVVAHPPCGPWGRLRHLSRRPQDRALGPLAVDQVRRFGGVLEHPAYSTLWEHCRLPKPGDLPDSYGGRTIEVEQVRWGHVARKRSWLYLVGISSAGANPPSRNPTHWISGARNPNPRYPRGVRGHAPAGIKFCSVEQRRRTPRAFAEFLIALALEAGGKP